MRNEFTIFSSSANPTLAATVARELVSQVGACVLDRYPDGDVAVQFDAVLHFDETRAVEPLETTAEWEAGEVPETFPFAV